MNSLVRAGLLGALLAGGAMSGAASTLAAQEIETVPDTLTLERVEHHHDLEQTSWIDDTRTRAAIWFPTSVE